LYHRLAALPIHLPPLRDRTGDVELLAWHFLRKSSERYHKQIDLITPSAMERLRAYDWPGNVRELEYMIERAVLLAEGPAVGLEDLSELSPDPSLRCTTLHAQLRAEKRRRVENTLRETLGNCAEAARLLGMSRGNFSRLLRALRVDPNKFRPK
jgi:DNA-binding NtrC family response regulator